MAVGDKEDRRRPRGDCQAFDFVRQTEKSVVPSADGTPTSPPMIADGSHAIGLGRYS